MKPSRVSTEGKEQNSTRKPLELFELEDRLKHSLKSCKLKDVTQLTERIKRTEVRIQQYIDETRNEEAEKETQYLSELKQLETLRDNIVFRSIEYLSKNIDELDTNELEARLKYGLERCKIQDISQIEERIQRTEQRIESYQHEDRLDGIEQEMKYLHDLQFTQIILKEIFHRQSVKKNDENKCEQIELNDLIDELNGMPECAERTLMELLKEFYERLLNDKTHKRTSNSIRSKLNQLEKQFQLEDFFSEQIERKLQEINRTIENQDCSFTLYNLNQLFKSIRPLNLCQIQRYVKRFEQTAALVHSKDIILLVGATGCGKSTTAQFLTGAKMKQTKVEICPGKFLEHITIDGPITNPGLIDVQSSPLSKSETRFMIPIFIPLKDIFGAYDSSEIIVCDAPGFSDTQSPEIDIANCLGTIKVLKQCKSVKIFALSSYRSLGDRGQGIEQLIDILTHMIKGIDHRLNSILFGFTKYSSDFDIHAMLTDMKNSRIDSNQSFLSVLNRMIQTDSIRIDPLNGDVNNVIENLRNLRGILYPDEVFQYSLAPQTRSVISNQISQYKSRIDYALKTENFSFLAFYFNQFQSLSTLVGETFIEEDLFRLIKENHQDNFERIIENLNQLLKTDHKLIDRDIEQLEKTSIFLRQITEHFHFHDLFTEGLHLQLENYDLSHTGIGIFLDNLSFFQKCFPELESFYLKYCRDLSEQFQVKYGQSIDEMISSHQFRELSEILDKISQLIPSLNEHLHKKIEKKYSEIIEKILQHFQKISDRSKSILFKTNLNENDLKSIEDDLLALKSARETKLFEKHTTKSLNHLFDEFIGNLLKFTEEIRLKIKEYLEKYDFDLIEPLIEQFRLLRTISDIERQTNRNFHKMIESICLFIRKLRRETEELLHEFDFPIKSNQIRKLTNFLSQLKQVQWIDKFSPKFVEKILEEIQKEFVEQMENLEWKLKKLNLDFHHPDNVRLANEILQKIHSFKDFHRFLPQLQICEERINNELYQSIKTIFESIPKKYNLQERKVDNLRIELNHLKELQRRYESFCPSVVYLKELGYANINQVKNEIEERKKEDEKQNGEYLDEKNQLEKQINELEVIIQSYEKSILLKVSKNIFGKIFNKLTNATQQNEVLKQNGYSNMNQVDEKVENYRDDLEKIHQTHLKNQNNLQRHLTNLQAIENHYSKLIQEDSDEGNIFLNQNFFDNYEDLLKKIEQITNVLNDYNQSKQEFYFHEEFDGLSMNCIFIYLNEYDNFTNSTIQRLANKINEDLKVYLREYVNFIEKEIERYFNCLTQSKINEFYQEKLQRYILNLLSMKKFESIFKYSNGEKKLKYFQKKFVNYHHSIINEIEEDKTNENYGDFKEKLFRLQSFICIDEFFIELNENEKFAKSFREYQIDFLQISEQIYQSMLDSLSKQDFLFVNSKLSYMIEIFANQRFLSHLKTNLETNLELFIKNTKRCANLFAENLQFKQENEQKLIASLDHLRVVLRQKNILNFIEKILRISLENLSNEVEQILTKKLLDLLQSIDNSFKQNDFLSIEKTIEYVNYFLNRFHEYFLFKSIEHQIDEIKRRICRLPKDILKQYDFVDLSKYLKDSPKYLCQQLKLVSSNGYTKYFDVYRQILEKIRTNFLSEINNVKDNRVLNRSSKMQSIRDAYYSLPDELQSAFRYDIEEINQLIRKEVHMPEID